MSVIYRCDLCGKKIGDGAQKLGTFVVNEKPALPQQQGGGMKKSKYLFCKDCVKEVEEFVKNKQGEDIEIEKGTS